MAENGTSRHRHAEAPRSTANAHRAAPRGRSRSALRAFEGPGERAAGHAPLLGDDRLGERVVVVGCSTGGTLATWLAASGADLAALVLISPNYKQPNEWKFSVGAVMALVHDVVIVVGFFSAFQVDFDLTAYAGQTVVLGFSFHSDSSVT